MCSAPCGGGRRSRLARCVMTRGAVATSAPMSSCEGREGYPVGTAAEDMLFVSAGMLVEDCNEDACPAFNIRVGQWGLCSARCGGGVSTRAVWCTKSSDVDAEAAASLEIITSKGDTVAYQEYNKLFDARAACVLEGDSALSSVATPEMPAAVSAVLQLEGKTAADAPTTRRDCNTAACESFTWRFADDWSNCSVPCGSGTQTRTAVCRSVESSASVVVLDGRVDGTASAACDGVTLDAPAVRRTCNTRPCAADFCNTVDCGPNGSCDAAALTCSCAAGWSGREDDGSFCVVRIVCAHTCRRCDISRRVFC